MMMIKDSIAPQFSKGPVPYATLLTSFQLGTAPIMVIRKTYLLNVTSCAKPDLGEKSNTNMKNN